MTYSKTKANYNLKLKEFKLNALLDVTVAINNNAPREKLFGIFEFILRNQLNIGKVVLFSYDNNSWKCVLKYGSKGLEKQFDVEKDLLHIEEMTLIESSTKDHLDSFNIVIPVYHKNIPLAYLLLGDLDEHEIKMSPAVKHLPFIQTLANIIVTAIENKRMAKESIRQERIKKELELASEMQAMLFPEKLPDNDILQIATYYQPHQQVGGDYYDYIPLGNNEVIFCMADVSGKGVSAALLMANFQANLRALVQYKTDLTEIIVDLNDKVMKSAKGEKFITLFIAKYNCNTRILHYINAAHNPPILYNKENILLLKTGCTGLGMFEELPTISEGLIDTAPNSILLCYTDGIVELENEKHQDFGLERLNSILQNNYELNMKDLILKVKDEVERFKGDMPYIDDIALFSCRFF